MLNLHFAVVEPIPLLNVFLVRHHSVVSTCECCPGGRHHDHDQDDGEQDSDNDDDHDY